MSHSRRLARNVEQFRAKSSPDPVAKRVKPGTPHRRQFLAKFVTDAAGVEYQLIGHHTKGFRWERQPAASAAPLFVPKMNVRPLAGVGMTRQTARLSDKHEANRAYYASAQPRPESRQVRRATERRTYR